MAKIQLTDRFHMEVKEQGAGVPIVLLHGYCGSSDYWHSVVPLLSERYHVITPDLRGHGKTQAPNGAYTIEQMADDILQMADKLHLDRFILLGHSLGGYIALSFAQRFSERLLGFGLIHSTGYADSDEARQGRLKAVEDIQAHGIVPFIDQLIPSLFNPNRLEQLEDEVRLAKAIGYHTPPQGAIGAALAMREREDRTAVMAATKLPLLLVAGRMDQKVRPERLFTTEGSNVTQAVIETAGHMGMMETPEEVNEIVSSFVHEITNMET
ncbi:alpha/beta fold hydrolase [Paenibacillus sp. UMB4589-SE434]|uniref:alpha/beta fold hydrolase n=1 Tax=Paenibacillus sp. UMB4589-SE434 TaxID=3046314 RepID=UPI002550F877|nr:alpha/beta fold hydrolase [Paenibacillus sp. UMB4589-SE434]MDK8183175.1 alpha/beta fold hydrolase [Paenibacillus sp. UMB4589-SE434]